MLKTAIIGCGDMGKMHAQCIAELEHVENWAFCDLDLSKAQALQSLYQAEVATQDANDIFGNADVDVVYITTQTNMHLTLCLAAFQSGKHVFIEKPLAVNIQDARKIREAAAVCRQVVMVGLKFRFYSLIREAASLIPNPFMVSVQVLDDPWHQDFWANDPVLGGGNVVSQGVHGTDLLRFLSRSDPQRVFAAGANYHQKTGIIDNLSATFLFENGISGSLVVGDTGQPPMLGKFCVQVFGAEGSLILTNRLTHLEFRPRNSDDILKLNGTEDGLMEENRAFIKAINDNLSPEATIHDGYISQAMIDSAIRSLKTGKVERNF